MKLKDAPDGVWKGSDRVYVVKGDNVSLYLPGYDIGVSSITRLFYRDQKK